MRYVAALVALLFCTGAALAEDAAPAKPALGDLQLKYRWVFLMTNLARDEVLAKNIDLVKRAKEAGYNGFYVVDSKFAKCQLQDKHYNDNVRKLREAFTAAGMQLAIGVCPFGYASEFLAADPNLAEGTPVRGAPFVVKDGKLVPVDDTAKLTNGAFAEWKGDSPAGWTADDPGTVSFKDDKVLCNGKPSLRQEHGAGKRGVARVVQKIKVRPWNYYHLSVMVKTQDCTSKDFRLFALAGDHMSGYPLDWQPPEVKKTQDWTRWDATFGSLDNEEVGIYIGSYNAKGGTIWYGDVQLEPAGFMNVLRRPSLPVTVTSEDGKTAYAEGKDFAEIKDPKLGHDPNPGYFTHWHDPPAIAVPEGSALKDGQKVLASYHVATLAGKPEQITCCLSEPKIYDILKTEVEWARDTARPDIYIMSHDEIRDGGWDDTCAKRNMTCGQVLAENIKKCTDLIAKADPGKPIAVWNDMFDPFHNAHKEGYMYLAKGVGPWYGSWEGLAPSVIVANWHQNNADSLKFFAERGNAQILAGYYDADPKRIVEWLEMGAKVKGVSGVMYTTWCGDYSKIEEFLKLARDFEAGQAKKN